MPALTVSLFVRVIGILLLLAFIHLVAAMGTSMFLNIFFPDEEYENYTTSYYVTRIALVVVAGAAVTFAIRMVFFLGDASYF